MSRTPAIGVAMPSALERDIQLADVQAALEEAFPGHCFVVGYADTPLLVCSLDRHWIQSADGEARQVEALVGRMPTVPE